jgi:hypothetical protein
VLRRAQLRRAEGAAGSALRPRLDGHGDRPGAPSAWKSPAWT